jgi:hypothetical protein
MMESAGSGSMLRRTLLLVGGMLGASALFVGMLMLVLGLLVDKATGASTDSSSSSKADKPAAAATTSPSERNKATLLQRGGST